MPNKRISPKAIKKILTLFATTPLSQGRLARAFKVSKSTVNAYLSLYASSDLSFADVSTMPDKEIVPALLHNRGPCKPPRMSPSLSYSQAFISGLNQIDLL
jgi:hypothetical protein